MAYINGNQLKTLWEIAWNNADNGNSVSDICSELESILRGLGNTGDNKLRTKDARIAIDTMTFDNDLVIVTDNFNISSIDNRSFVHTQRGTQSIDRHSLFAESSIEMLIPCEVAQAILYADWLSAENEAQESLTTWRDTRINGLSPIDDMLREQSNVLNRLADIRLGAYRTLVNLEYPYHLIADNVLLLAAR